RALDPGRVAPDLAAGRVDQLPEGRHPVRGIAGVGEPDVPGIRVGHGDPEHPRADGADHERWAMRTRPARQQLAVARLVELPVEVDGALTQEGADDGERLLEPIDAVIEREAERAELRVVPAGAETEDQAAATDLVDRRG